MILAFILLLVFRCYSLEPVFSITADFFFLNFKQKKTKPNILTQTF